jgi:AdoMet-dependent rRNA methyltransferase SPB1
MPVSSVLIGVDLAAIKPVGNAVLLQQDITTSQCRSEIKKSLHGWKVDVYANLFDIFLIK